MLDDPELQLLVAEISRGISSTFRKSPTAGHGVVSGGVSNAQDLSPLIAHNPSLNTIVVPRQGQNVPSAAGILKWEKSWKR